MKSTGVTRSRPKHLQIVTPEEELENLKNEVGVLHRAVESKSAAVGILRAELQECQKERDKFRTLAEQGGGPALHRPLALTPTKAALTDPGRSAMLSGAGGTLAQLLCQAKEENRMLRQDATELRCRLHDAQADTKVLREEVQRWRGGGEGRRGSQHNTALTQLALQERERFISQMEELSAKCQALEGDVRGLVEEREELVRELDTTHHKLHRLNYILNTVLNNPQHHFANTSSNTTPTPPKRIVDLDGIITENRYLQQRLKQAEEEVTLARSNSSKYKSALERCRTQGTIKLGTSENLIVTPKQVSEILQEYRGEVGCLAESDLRSLCVALVDALAQRSRALRTQRLANRVLVNRVNELERRLLDQGGQGHNSKAGSGPSEEAATSSDFPLATQQLLDGYTPPAGLGSLAGVKEEDVTRDPRLAKYLRPHLTPQPPPHPRNAGDGGEMGEGEMNGGMEDKELKIAREGDGESDVDSKTEMDNQTSDESGENMKGKEDEDVTDGGASGTSRETSRKNVIEELEEEEEHVPLLSDPHKHSDDDLEEIVPLDKLDAYIKEVHMKRRTQHKGKGDKRNTKHEKAEHEEKRSLAGDRKDGESERDQRRKDGESERDVKRKDGESERDVKRKDGESERDQRRKDGESERDQRRMDGESERDVKRKDGDSERDQRRKDGETERDQRQESNAQKKVNKDRKETKERRDIEEGRRGEADGEGMEPKEQKREHEIVHKEEKTEIHKEEKREIHQEGKREIHQEGNREIHKEGKTEIHQEEKRDVVNAEKQTETQNATTAAAEKDDTNLEDDDDSIDLDLSDYDSDNDKLDMALEEWKNDCGGKKPAGEATSPLRGGKKKGSGGKKEGFRLWRKEQKSCTDDMEIPSALQGPYL